MNTSLHSRSKDSQKFLKIRMNRCVKEILECLDLEQSLTSHHLKELPECGLIEKKTRWKTYLL